MSHTPTPWTYEKCYGLDRYDIYGLDGEPVVFGNDPVSGVFKKIDADFIVRACNVHEDLLSALKAWRAFWDDMPKGQLGKLCFDAGLLNEAFLSMDKAISKAEGRSA